MARARNGERKNSGLAFGLILLRYISHAFEAKHTGLVAADLLPAPKPCND
jgi:hypothetical protein